MRIMFQRAILFILGAIFPISALAQSQLTALPPATPAQIRTIDLQDAPLEQVAKVKPWPATKTVAPSIEGSLDAAVVDDAGTAHISLNSTKIEPGYRIRTLQMTLLRLNIDDPEAILGQWQLPPSDEAPNNLAVLGDALVAFPLQPDSGKGPLALLFALSSLNDESNGGIAPGRDFLAFAASTPGTVHTRTVRPLHSDNTLIAAGQHYDCNGDYEGGWFSLVAVDKGTFSEFLVPDAAIASIAFDENANTYYFGGANGKGALSGADAMVEKRDSNGALKWRVVIKDANEDISIAARPDGVVAAFHLRECKPLDNCLGMVRLNEDGTVVWQKRFDLGNRGEYPYILLNDREKVVLAGTHNTQSSKDSGFALAFSAEGQPLAGFFADEPHTPMKFLFPRKDGSFFGMSSGGDEKNPGRYKKRFLILPPLQ